MSIIVDQQWDDSEDIGITDGSAELPFVILGTYSGLAARQALYAYLLQLGYDREYHGCSLMNVSLKREAPTIFKATAKYNKILNKIKFTVDGTAEKVKKTKSIETIENIRVRDIANLGWAGPDFGGLVNVSKDKVDGVEVYTPGSLKLTMQWSAKYQDIRSDYMSTAIAMQATVNDDDILLNYKGQNFYFACGTLVFIGPVFDETLNDGSDITLKFECSLNKEDIVLGEINGTSSPTWLTTGDTTNTSNLITSLPKTDSLIVGMSVTGTGIPAGSKITGIQSDTSITISNGCTATNAGEAIGFSLGAIEKQGWFYLWVRTRKIRNNGVEVETPDSVHIERMYEYDDFTKLEVFDKIEAPDDEFEQELEDAQAEEEG